MQAQIDKLRAESDKIAQKLSDSSILATKDGQDLARKQAELAEILSVADRYQKLQKAYDDTKKLAQDSELGTIAQEELPKLEQELAKTKAELDGVLTPRDPRDQKNAIIEIRAGAGGAEASLFAGDLYRMYVKYAEHVGYKAELLSQSGAEQGGFKEVIFKISSNGVYGKLKYESGVHRVQRVPTTESAGRIHTSTATVAVLPEATNTDIEINPADIRIDVFRSSGAGGQSVNTTDSAVRITYLPTGMIVTCQDERSQLKNREKALGILRARLLSQQIEKERVERDQERRGQIGTGERSEKIRTYNFPQDRLTDHRINLSLHNLPSILAGNIDELINKLQTASQKL